VRALTDSEARVIAVLLAARPDRERERLRLAKIPRSTYHAVRRRAYQEGWLEDRYVPHPVPLGRPYVTFLLVRPYADRLEELVKFLTADPGAVVVWTGAQAVLAVLLHTKPEQGQRVVDQATRANFSPPPTVLTVPADGPSIPVYFDFEGLWCHVAGLTGTLAYPHGLGGGTDDDGESAALTAHQSWAMRELLRRPFVAAEQGRGGHLVGPFGLPFSQRRMLQRGWIVHRTLLDPARIPPFRGRAADQIVFLTGAPRSGARPELLFSTLTRESRVFPFLFVVAESRWLLGALGSAAPAPAPDELARRPVLPTLREYLEGIEIVQEAASAFSAPLDHRYDRLLLPPPPDGRPRANG
jgi:hypothetical protein